MMKISYLIIVILFVFGFVMFSCKSEVTNTDEITNITDTVQLHELIAEGTEKYTEEVTDEETPDKLCLLTSLKFKLGESNRIFSFTYADDMLVSSQLEIEGQENKQIVDYIFEGDNIKQLTTKPDGGNHKFIYDQDGILSEIQYSEPMMPKKFEHNAKGRIIKEKTIYNGEAVTVIEYEYADSDNPVKMQVYANNVKQASIEFFYDDKHNPFKNKSAFVNAIEMRFGYPVANTDNNLVKFITTYHEKTPYKVNGEYKQAGDVDTEEIGYEYNEQGYPVSMTMNNETLTLFYECQ